MFLRRQLKCFFAILSEGFLYFELGDVSRCFLMLVPEGILNVGWWGTFEFQ